jgi:hypothetical protein
MSASVRTANLKELEAVDVSVREYKQVSVQSALEGMFIFFTFSLS